MSLLSWRRISGSILSACLVVPVPASAGTYSGGFITQLIVGRNQNEVILQVSGGVQSDWPCASTHPNNLNYMFKLDRPDGAALLSTLMTAYTSNLRITVSGAATCAGDPRIEDVAYLILPK